MNKLILDLRSNPGGYLSAAINMVDEFYLKEKLLFTQKVLFEINRFTNRQTMVDLKKKNS